MLFSVQSPSTYFFIVFINNCIRLIFDRYVTYIRNDMEYLSKAPRILFIIIFTTTNSTSLTST